MAINKFIKVKFQMEGVHCWPDCDIPEMIYLRDVHRHMFYFECVKQVTDSNREIEFIQWQRRIIEHLDMVHFDDKLQLLNFGNWSCEQIAESLIVHFDLRACQVLEDGDVGAFVTNTDQ